jgi:hypothetical protein
LVTIEIEKDIVLLVENAIEKLNIVKENTQKGNKMIVINLAKDLEGIIPMNNICKEIINRLHGRLSPRTIRKYLDEKYKVKSRVENARKQKNNQSSLAALGPLNNNGGTIVVNDRNELSFPDGNNRRLNQPIEFSVVKDSEAIQALSQKESLNSIKQEHLSIGQAASDLTECPGCIEKEEENKQLKEALQKVQQFTVADKMRPSDVAESFKEKPEDPLEFEVSKKGWEIRDYFRSSKIKSYDETIWFNGRIDTKLGKIINFDLGRIGPQQQIDDST